MYVISGGMLVTIKNGSAWRGGAPGGGVTIIGGAESGGSIRNQRISMWQQ